MVASDRHDLRRVTAVGSGHERGLRITPGPEQHPGRYDKIDSAASCTSNVQVA